MTQRKKNAAAVYLSKWPRSSDTYRTMKQALDRVAGILSGCAKADCEEFDWHALRFEDARSIPAELLNLELKPKTVNKMLSAVRGTLEVAWRMGMMDDDVYRRIEIENVSGNSQPAGRALAHEEMDTLANECLTGDPEECAAIAALAGAGLRRVELVRLTGADYDAATKRLRVRGKGNKVRAIPMANRWAAIFEGWWKTKTEREPIFDFADGAEGGRRHVSYIVAKFNARCKFPQPFTPHDLRRTFLTHVESVAGIATAQKLGGHSNIATTGLYVRVDEEREAAAVRDL